MTAAEYNAVIHRAARVVAQLNGNTKETRLLHFIGALQAGLEAGGEHTLAEEVSKVSTTKVRQ
jgi:hypothetical protein